MVAAFTGSFSSPGSPFGAHCGQFEDRGSSEWPQGLMSSISALGQVLTSQIKESGYPSAQEFRQYLQKGYADHLTVPQTKSQRRFSSSSSNLDSARSLHQASNYNKLHSATLPRRGSSGAFGLERGLNYGVVTSGSHKVTQIEVVEVDESDVSALDQLSLNTHRTWTRRRTKQDSTTPSELHPIPRPTSHAKSPKLSNAVHAASRDGCPRPQTRARSQRGQTSESHRPLPEFCSKPRSKKATKQDGRKWEIPDNYSLRYWDPSEEPILLFQHAFDAKSLGIRLYDWTVAVHGAQSPESFDAALLRVSIVQLFGNVGKAEVTIRDVRRPIDRRTLNEFIDAGERLMEKFCLLLRTCETQALKRTKKSTTNGKNGGTKSGKTSTPLEPQEAAPKSETRRKVMGLSTGVTLAKILFRQEGGKGRTHELLQAMKLFNLRFTANCESIMRDPKGMRDNSENIKQAPATAASGALLSRENSHVVTHKEATGYPTPATSTDNRNEVRKPSVVEDVAVESPAVSTPGASASSDDTDDEAVIGFLPFTESDGDTQILQNHPFSILLQPLRTIALKQYAAWRSHNGGGRNQTTAASTKRRRSDNTDRNSDCDANETDNEDDQNDNNNKDNKRARGPDGSTVQPEGDDSGPTLACPFYKHDKIRHSRCLYMQLKRIKDVKQHLRRAHAQPRFCPICGKTFADSQDDLNAHLIARSCEQQIFTRPEGVTDEHKTKFTQRVGRTLTLREQWFTVWDILFPGKDRPDSPFVDGPVTEICDELIRWWDRNGRSIVYSQIESRGGLQAFEEQLRNPERDLASLFVVVGRDFLTTVVEQMMQGDQEAVEAVSGLSSHVSGEVAGEDIGPGDEVAASSPQLTTATTIEHTDAEGRSFSRQFHSLRSAPPLDDWQEYQFDQQLLMSSFNEGHGFGWHNGGSYEQPLPAYVFDEGEKVAGGTDEVIGHQGGIL